MTGSTGGIGASGARTSAADAGELEGVSQLLSLGASGGGAAVVEPEAQARFDVARLAASGQAAQLAQMARLLDTESRMSAAASSGAKATVTPLDGKGVDWATYKPTRADKELIAELVNLPADELVERLGALTPAERNNLLFMSFQVLGDAPNAISEALWHRQPDIEAAFIRHLLAMPEAEFKEWFVGASMEETDAIANRFNEDYRDIFGGDLGKAQALLERFNGLHEERAAKLEQRAMDKVLMHYQGRTETTYGPEKSKRDIQREIEGRLAAARRDWSDRTEVDKILSDMRRLAANPSPEAQELYEMYREALADAVGTDHVAASVLAQQAAKLDGAASAEVKGALIPILYAQIDAGRYVNVEVTIEALIRSDPAGVLEVMEGADLEGGKKLVNRALADIAKLYKDDHEALSDAMSDILAPYAAEVALAAAAEPWDAEASTRLDSAAHDLGVALGAVQNAVDGLGDEARKKIAHGAFILSVFHKGVAKISGVPQIEKAGDAIVGKLAEMENEAVSDWTKKLKEAAMITIDEVFQRRTEGMDRSERRRRQDAFEIALQAGYQATRDLKGKK